MSDTTNNKIRLVCASRYSYDDFFKKSALGRSFVLYKSAIPALEIFIFPENQLGLPMIYNNAIEHARESPAILVFVHDDVYLSDFYWTTHLVQALNTFDVVGVVGNRQRQPGQVSWYFLNDSFVKDEPHHLSGVIGHGQGFPMESISVYGPPGQECKLLDGLLLAAHSQTLIDNELRFDPLFDFHFYDMDFCRQAEAKGLRMGTCHVCVIHESSGSFQDAWRAGLQKYRSKYSD